MCVVLAVVGCSDPKPPGTGWMKRNGNHVTMGCTETDDEWRLSCHGNEWVGKVGNCTPGEHLTLTILHCYNYTLKLVFYVVTVH